MRELKFRAYQKNGQGMVMLDPKEREQWLCGLLVEGINWKVMQHTGLHDKSELQEVYEGDIIDEYGNIKGNIYEMDKGETDFVVQGFGDKNWGATYKEALVRGCTNT